MSYLVVCDSGCDLTPELHADERVVSVPLTVMVDDYEVVDDDGFDQAEFIRRMKASKNPPRSACP